ncbi:hypothetical protein ABZ609_03300 [Streptomyces rubiginosohelvolus]|uniref:hypothetical protein n=1 Tax=Streptomyces rubiginosohelvolus TaxID=67362 RepID=UPI0033E374B4
MTATRLVGGVGVCLGDDEITTRVNEYQQASIRFGFALTMDVTDAPPEQLRRLAQVAEDLAAWREERDRAADVADEVAAEDGVRSIGVPIQRGPVATSTTRQPWPPGTSSRRPHSGPASPRPPRPRR